MLYFILYLLNLTYDVKKKNIKKHPNDLLNYLHVYFYQ